MEICGLDFPLWAIFLPLLLYLAYKHLTKNFGFFKNLGIDGPRPYPLFGTILPILTKGLMRGELEFRQKYGKVVGTFFGSVPTLLVFDTDMLKQIMVKNFSAFQNRRTVQLDDPLLDKILTQLKDDEWRRVRNRLTPTFTGSRLRKMTSQINKCAFDLRENLGEKARNDEIFNLKAFAEYYTMDVVASTAFGIKVNSQKDPNNKFAKAARKAFVTDSARPMSILFSLFPFLVKYMAKLKLPVLASGSEDFFIETTKMAMKVRRENPGKEYTDFLQLMLNALADELDVDPSGVKHGISTIASKSGLTEDEVLAQSLMFFLDPTGFGPTAITLSYVGYSLACNPDKQDKLIQEIDEVTKDHEEIDYDLVKKMPYLQMCIEESTRLYPAVPRMDRVAGEDVTINGVFIPKGTIIGLAFYAIQRDPDLWEDPEKFIPERFTPEAKAARDPYSYMPFGMGPRNCVGMRLVLLGLKIAVAQVLKRFKFVTCEKTEIPIKMKKISMDAENGFMLKMQAR